MVQPPTANAAGRSRKIERGQWVEEIWLWVELQSIEDGVDLGREVDLIE